MAQEKEKIIVRAKPIGTIETIKLKMKGASEAKRDVIEVDTSTQMASSAAIMGLVSETYHAIGVERRKFLNENSILEGELIRRENDLERIAQNDHMDIDEKRLKIKRLMTEIDYFNNELKKCRDDHNEIIFMHHELLFRKFSIYWRAALKKDGTLPAQPRIYTPLVQKEEWIRSNYLEGGMEYAENI